MEQVKSAVHELNDRKGHSAFSYMVRVKSCEPRQQLEVIHCPYR